MKIAAKPIGLPKPSQVTEKVLAQTPAGKKAITTIQEGINTGCLSQRSVKEYLKTWAKYCAKAGTCFGQAASVIISKAMFPNKSEKSVVKDAGIADSIAFQILSEFAFTSRHSISIGKKMVKLMNKADKKIESKEKEIAKYKKKHGNTKSSKLKNLTKKRDKLQTEKEKFPQKMEKASLKQTKKIGLIFPKFPFQPKAQAKLKEFSKKIAPQSCDLIKAMSGLERVAKETFSSKDAFNTRMEELVNQKKAYAAIQVKMLGKPQAHYIALFLGERSNIYDANFGFTDQEKADDFLKDIKDIYTSENSAYSKIKVDYTKFELEFFKPSKA
jgi:hypothetical protein